MILQLFHTRTNMLSRSFILSQTIQIMGRVEDKSVELRDILSNRREYVSNVRDERVYMREYLSNQR